MREFKKGLWTYAVIVVIMFTAVFASTGFILASASSSEGGADAVKEMVHKPRAAIKIKRPQALQNVPEISAEEYYELEQALDDDENNEIYEESENEENPAEADKITEFPYYIKVNRLANCVTVYAKDEAGAYTIPVRAMICSVGLNNNTPIGVFKTSTKYAWRALYGGVYGQYAFRIHGAILFHSVPYFSKSKDDLEYEEYNKLGEPASLGCVRLAVEDAKWLIDNCPSGTMVEIYDSEDPGPLGRPSSVRIPPESPYRGWDPTDPDPENPWINVGPVISGAADRTFSEGSVLDLLSGVSASDYLGRSVEVAVSGTVDTTLPGVYAVVYSAADGRGNVTTVSANITILAAPVSESTQNSESSENSESIGNTENSNGIGNAGTENPGNTENNGTGSTESSGNTENAGTGSTESSGNTENAGTGSTESSGNSENAGTGSTENSENAGTGSTGSSGNTETTENSQEAESTNQPESTENGGVAESAGSTQSTENVE